MGLVVLALGIVAAAVAQNLPLIVVAAALVGAGVGISTPFAFSHLAQATPPERMGRTMGSAEVGRELGDAGGPLLVGGVATIAGLSGGLFALAGAIGVAAVAAVAGTRRDT